jgi:hypothetical protein
VGTGEGWSEGPVADASIQYVPPKNCQCDKIGFIQLVKTHIDVKWLPDVDHDWKLDSEDPNNVVETSDYPETAFPYYPQHDPWTRGSTTPYASMDDRPGFESLLGWKLFRSMTMDFITCGVCMEGKDAGKIYGCVKWGFSITGPNTSDFSGYGGTGGYVPNTGTVPPEVTQELYGENS